jgi:hypothetical protein
LEILLSKKGGYSMVEFTDIKDNSDEIMKCIVNCETDKNLDSDMNKNKNKTPPDSVVAANKEEYIDEP